MAISDEKRIFQVDVRAALWFQSHHILGSDRPCVEHMPYEKTYFIGTVSHADHDLPENMAVFPQGTLSLESCCELDMECIRFVDNLNRQVRDTRERLTRTTYFSITPNRLNSSIKIRASPCVRKPNAVNHVPSFPLSLFTLNRPTHTASSERISYSSLCRQRVNARCDIVLGSLIGLNEGEVVIRTSRGIQRLFHTDLGHQSEIVGRCRVTEEKVRRYPTTVFDFIKSMADTRPCSHASLSKQNRRLLIIN